MLQFDGKVRLDALLRRKDHAFDRAGRRDAVADDYGRIDAEHGRTAHVFVIHRVPERIAAAQLLVDAVKPLGEYLDKKYQRYLPGLELTQTMIIPHYNEIHDDCLDGVHIFKDIAYPDSAKRTFIVLVDGSFIHIHEGKEVIHGLSYKIEKGKQSLIQEKDCMFTLDS